MDTEVEMLLDQDIKDTIAGMSQGELSEELARLEREEEKEELSRSSIEEFEEIADKARQLTAEPGVITTKREQKALDGLLMAGAHPGKALNWLIAQRKIGLDTSDLEAREVVSSQHLLPDKVYQEEAAKQLRNEFVNQAITDNPELPTTLIKEMARSRTKGESALLLRKYGQELVATAKDEANAYLLEQSQDQFLPRLLRSRIAGLSVSNLDEARAEVDKLIRNFRR